MKKYQEDFLIHLIRSEALKFGTFKLKSGRISPYFINIAKAMNTGSKASMTANSYASEIVNGHIGVDFDYIHGPAYKGIPLSVMISSKLWDVYSLEKRWGYDRKEIKEYGDNTEKELIGDIRDGDTVLIVDDVITTGKTKIDNWKTLSFFKKDLKPKGILVAVDRQEIDESGRPTSEILEEEGLPVYSILKISDVFEYLFEISINGKTYVDEEIKKCFDDYFKKYGVKD